MSMSTRRVGGSKPARCVPAGCGPRQPDLGADLGQRQLDLGLLQGGSACAFRHEFGGRHEQAIEREVPRRPCGPAVRPGRRSSWQSSGTQHGHASAVAKRIEGLRAGSASGKAGRCEGEQEGNRLPEQGGRDVHRADIAKHLGPEDHSGVRVPSERPLALVPTVHVVENTTRQLPFGDAAKIVHRRGVGETGVPPDLSRSSRIGPRP